MPARDGVLVRAKIAGRSVDRISPRSSGVMPKSASASSVRPAPSRPIKAQDLAAMQDEGHVLEFAGAAAPAHLEHRAAHLRSGRAMTSCSMLSPVISSASRWSSTSAAGKGADLAPVAQHRHALGDLDDLFEPMADEDDRDAQRLQAADGLRAAGRPRAASATRSVRP